MNYITLNKNYNFCSFFKDTNRIPTITTKAPINWSRVSVSFKKIVAKIIVEIGPIPATIAKFEELIILMEIDTKNDGITVAKTAIKNPKV